LLLAWRFLPVDRAAPQADRGGFDRAGTLLLASTLAAYALAMTVGRGQPGLLNAVLLLAAVAGAGLFVVTQARAASPLIRLAAFRDAGFSAGLAMNALVATVMMATLVVGPFYLARAQGLDEALVGMVMSIGPIISILGGVPAGRIVDRLGAPIVVVAGLVLLAAGCCILAAVPAPFGIAGYIAAIAVLTPGYQLFQAANNTSVMMDVRPDQRGVMSGMLNLSRNLGLVTGASAMGAVFALAAGTSDVTAAAPATVAAAMRLTFAVAAALMLVALAIALAGAQAKRVRVSGNAS
jgi:MFS family permease